VCNDEDFRDQLDPIQQRLLKVEKQNRRLKQVGIVFLIRRIAPSDGSGVTLNKSASEVYRGERIHPQRHAAKRLGFSRSAFIASSTAKELERMEA
jgi:hypothetical protein